LVGTETGDILSLERKAKKDAGSQISVKQMFGGGESASHLGPVYSVKVSSQTPFPTLRPPRLNVHPILMSSIWILRCFTGKLMIVFFCFVIVIVVISA
jgi:hypothetical protein